MVSGDLWGGAEAQVYQLVKHTIEKDNCKVCVITLNKGVLFDKLCDLSISVVAIEENKRHLWEMIAEMRSFFKKNSVHLIHCHGFKENFLAGIAGKMSGKLVTTRTHHGRGVVRGSFPKVFVEKLNACFLTDKMIAVSHELKTFLTENGFSSSKIKVIHNGIDCENLSVSKDRNVIREELLIPSDSFVIGTASRIELEKGYEYLLSAVKKLIDEGLPIVFVIVGTGNLKQKYQQMAKEMNISEFIIFVGFQENVCNYLNIFDVFVMMSLHEGLPLTLLEVMCMGKPVVCSAVGGIPEIVESNFSGILVPSKDYEACAEACKKILNYNDFKVRIEENACNHIKTNFSSTKTAESTIQLYKKILER